MEARSHTAEVGRRGVFVVSERPWPRRKLVSLVLVLPDGEEFEVHGMVARTVSTEESQRADMPPGMGIQFYGLSRLAQDQWEAFFYGEDQGSEGSSAQDREHYVVPQPGAVPGMSGSRIPGPDPTLELVNGGLEPPTRRVPPPSAVRAQRPPRNDGVRRERAPSLVIVPTGKEPPGPSERQPDATESVHTPASPEIAPPPGPPFVEPEPRTVPLYSLDRKPQTAAADEEEVIEELDNDILIEVEETPSIEESLGVPMTPDETSAALYHPGRSAVSPGEHAPEHPPFVEDEADERTAIEAPPGFQELRSRERSSAPPRTEPEVPGGRSDYQDVDGPTVIMELPDELREPRDSSAPPPALRPQRDRTEAAADGPGRPRPDRRGAGDARKSKLATFEVDVPTVMTPAIEVSLARPEDEETRGLPYAETQPSNERVEENRANASVGLAELEEEPEGLTRARRATPHEALLPASEVARPTGHPDGELRTTVATSKKRRVAQAAPAKVTPPWVAPKDQLVSWNPEAVRAQKPPQVVPHEGPLEWGPEGWATGKQPGPQARDDVAGYLPPGPALVPDDSMGYVVYRMALPTIEALQGFANTALVSNGVFVRTAQIRPPGTPAVVCVVHPMSGDEFHLPGEIVPTSPARPGVAVEFHGVTDLTVSEFRYFIALGIPEDDVGGAPAAEHAELAEGDEVLTMINSSPRLEAQKQRNVPRENTHDVKLKDIMVITSAGLPRLEASALGRTQEVSLEELVGSEDRER